MRVFHMRFKKIKYMLIKRFFLWYTTDSTAIKSTNLGHILAIFWKQDQLFRKIVSLIYVKFRHVELYIESSRKNRAIASYIVSYRSPLKKELIERLEKSNANSLPGKIKHTIYLRFHTAWLKIRYLGKFST